MQRIQYAKAKSDVISKAEGTYDKKKKQEEKGESLVLFSMFLYALEWFLLASILCCPVLVYWFPR